MIVSSEIEKLYNRPSIRGMLKQIDKVRNNNEELESMIQNQIRMEPELNVQETMGQIHLSFHFEQLLHLTTIMGLVHFRPVMASHANSLSAMFKVLGSEAETEETKEQQK